VSKCVLRTSTLTGFEEKKSKKKKEKRKEMDRNEKKNKRREKKNQPASKHSGYGLNTVRTTGIA